MIRIQRDRLHGIEQQRLPHGIEVGAQRIEDFHAAIGRILRQPLVIGQLRERIAHYLRKTVRREILRRSVRYLLPTGALLQRNGRTNPRRNLYVVVTVYPENLLRQVGRPAHIHPVGRYGHGEHSVPLGLDAHLQRTEYLFHGRLRYLLPCKGIYPVIPDIETERFGNIGYGNRIGNAGSYPPPGQLLNQKRGTFQGINRDIGVDTALETERRIRIDSVAACALAYPDRIEIGAFKEDVHRSVGNAGIPSAHDTRDTHRFLRIAYHQVSLRKRPFHPVERHEFRPLRAGLHYHPAPGNPVGIERVERLSQLVQDEVGNVHHIILGIEPYGTQTVLHPVG